MAERTGSHIYVDDMLIGCGQFYMGDTVIDSDNFFIVIENQLINADTTAQTTATQSLDADTSKTVTATQVLNGDTVTMVGTLVGTQTIDADTYRAVQATQTIDADTMRRILYVITGQSETRISLAINIGEMTLSDSYQMQTVDDIAIKTAVWGDFLDMNYRFIIDNRRWTGIQYDLQGTYDKDRQLYTPFVYVAASATTAMGHLQQLAAGMGLSVSADFEDFTPSQNMSEANASYKGLLANLFGWTNRVPRRMVNVFIRGDKLHVLQRGREPNAIDITNVEHTKPVFTETLIRSVWGANGGTGAHNGLTIEPEPFTGTKSWDGTKDTYVFGMLTQSVKRTETTTYNWTTFAGLIGQYLAGSVKETDTETYRDWETDRKSVV